MSTTTTKLAYTPGPWHVDEEDPSTNDVYSKSGDLLATAYERPTGLSNARLIAAAPEMLEALEEASSTMSHALCLLNDDGSCDLCTAEAKVKTAIRKAKGSL